MTIVATFRQAHGERFNSLQYVMFRFFVECGLVCFTCAFIPFALFSVMSDEYLIWKVSIFVDFFLLIVYMTYHLRRRIRLGVAMPLVSKITVVGYQFIGVIMIAAFFELWLRPSLLIIVLLTSWGLITNALIFVYFLGSFVEQELASDEV